MTKRESDQKFEKQQEHIQKPSEAPTPGRIVRYLPTDDAAKEYWSEVALVLDVGDNGTTCVLRVFSRVTPTGDLNVTAEYSGEPMAGCWCWPR